MSSGLYRHFSSSLFICLLLQRIDIQFEGYEKGVVEQKEQVPFKNIFGMSYPLTLPTMKREKEFQ